MRIAVVGSGIAGLSCVHVLGPHHEVTLFEADSRLGGHANTVTVNDPVAGPLAVDTGFIVHNDRNYPNLSRLLAELSIPVQDAEMSFGVTARNFGPGGPGLHLPGDQPAIHVCRPPQRHAPCHVAHARRHRSLLSISEPAHRPPGREPRPGRYRRQPCGLPVRRPLLPAFVDLHLVPMGASVWSADPTTFSAFPAVSLFRFLRNHGLLSFRNRPQWRTIVGGSQAYVNAIAERFNGTLRIATPVVGVTRDEQSVLIRTATGNERFDKVILACHSDQALGMLDDATAAEKDVLGAIQYQPNVATLHTDTNVLSPLRQVWAAWNYECPQPGLDPQGRAVLTYDMTTLQQLPGAHRYLVSLNSDHRIDPASVLASCNYSHPVFDGAAIASQARFEEIDGVHATHFCGAYWGYGFHEDGITSALRVCERLGVTW